MFLWFRWAIVCPTGNGRSSSADGRGTRIYQGIIGLAALIGLAWALSENRRAVNWRNVVAALGLQIALAMLLLRVPLIWQGLMVLNGAVGALSDATRAGTAFVFGYLGGGAAPFEVRDAASSFILGFQSLPLILVISALSALLWHWRILPVLVAGFAWLLQRVLGIGGATGLASAANIFTGMVEAPLLIRPYMAALTRSELFVVMTGGMATVAGSVMILYAGFLNPIIPGALGHILAASVISLPAAILIAQVMIPETAQPTQTSAFAPTYYDSTMDAITAGTQQGVALLAGVISMLIVLVALMALVNLALGALPDMFGAPLSAQRILGWAFAPLMWLIGIPWNEAIPAGALMGTKTVLNELIAYIDLAGPGGAALSDRSRMIMLYALCGFANFGSLGHHDRRPLGNGSGSPHGNCAVGNALYCGRTLATLMTGAIAGLI